MAFRTPKPTGMHVPAVPALARQLKQAHDPQQLVSRIRDGDLTGNPVPNGSGRDLKKLRGFIQTQARIREQDFEAGALYSAGFTGLSELLFPLTVLYTMYIMLI